MTTDRTQLFDQWAESYDLFITKDDDFPFDGYPQLLDEIVQRSAMKLGVRILDFGIGIGNVAQRFIAPSREIWGVDFSAKMLLKAQEKLSYVHLVQADLRQGWPETLPQQFDRIVSAYLFHEFSLSTKVRLLGLLAAHLKKGGLIIIGDIAFPTAKIREEAHARWRGQWDEEEFYWAADEMVDVCQEIGLTFSYQQISSCGGVFTFQTQG